MMILINLETMKQLEVDEAQLQNFGLPEGYRTLESISKEELWRLLKDLYLSREEWKSLYEYGRS